MSLIEKFSLTCSALSDIRTGQDKLFHQAILKYWDNGEPIIIMDAEVLGERNNAIIMLLFKVGEWAVNNGILGDNYE